VSKKRKIDKLRHIPFNRYQSEQFCIRIQWFLNVLPNQAWAAYIPKQTSLRQIYSLVWKYASYVYWGYHLWKTTG